MTTKEERTLFQELDVVAALDNAELENRLIDLRDRESTTQWDLGRVINDMYIKVRKHMVQRTKDDVCVYVARFIDSRARSVPAMRLYSQIAALFPPRKEGKSLRMPEDTYPLPFSHFQTAARYGEQRYEVLKASCKLMDNHNGRPVSADELERHMEASGVYPLADEIEQTATEGERELVPVPVRGNGNGNGYKPEPPTPYVLAEDDAKYLEALLIRMKIDAEELNQLSGKMRVMFPAWSKETSGLVRHAEKLLQEIRTARAMANGKKRH